MVTSVLNLKTGQSRVYCLPPYQAVVAAHAQMERGDYNTWSYADKYARKVKAGAATVSCGNCSALLSRTYRVEVLRRHGWEATATDRGLTEQGAERRAERIARGYGLETRIVAE